MGTLVVLAILSLIENENITSVYWAQLEQLVIFICIPSARTCGIEAILATCNSSCRLVYILSLGCDVIIIMV